MEGWIDAFSLSWCVPVIFDAIMTVVNVVYDFFVTSGVVQIFLYGFLAFSIGFYLIKMYFPKEWLELFNFSGGGEMYEGKIGAADIAKEVFKPMLRTALAVIFFLQIKPVYITQFIINPFLKFGEIYTSAIINVVNPKILETPVPVNCQDNLKGILNKDSCEFIMRPMGQISRINNKAMIRGFDFIALGGFLNIVAGVTLIGMFFLMNLFVAFTLIGGIFKFGRALIFYPFRVVVYVIRKTEKEEYWFTPTPVFGGIIDALHKLIIAMISVIFLVTVDIMVAGSMLNFDLDKTEGIEDGGFTIVTAVLFLWLTWNVFETTREQIKKYIDDDEMTGLYGKVSDRAKTIRKNTTDFIKKLVGVVSKNG